MQRVIASCRALYILQQGAQDLSVGFGKKKTNYNLEGEGEIVQFCDLKEPLSELGNEYT